MFWREKIGKEGSLETLSLAIWVDTGPLSVSAVGVHDRPQIRLETARFGVAAADGIDSDGDCVV